jgi:hypothetical protein
MHKIHIIDLYGGVEAKLHTLIDIPDHLHAFAMYHVRWSTR